MILLAKAEEYLRAFVALQPTDIQAHPFEVFVQNAAIHDDLGQDGILRRRQIKISGVHRTAGADRQNGQLAVVFVDCGLDVV